MTPNPHPECPICRLLDAAQGQPITIALRCLKLAEMHRCVCRGTTHKALLKHPHTVEGCVGFHAGSGVMIERVVSPEEVV
jgi:hypothetical protein